MKYYFIINPLAGSGKDRDVLINQIELFKKSFDAEIYYTKCEKDATRFVKETCEKNPKDELCFVACGGDGTINEVFSGAFGHENACVSVYPCGSGNDFVKCFEKDSFKDISFLAKGNSMLMDSMMVNDRLCFNIANFGFDATVAKTVNDDRKKNGHGSKNSYTTGIIKALIYSMKNEGIVYVDGKPLNPEGKYLLCTIGNGQYVGGSFNCSPRACLDDGLLEICLVKCISRLKFVSLIGTYTNGKHLDSPKYAKIMEYRRSNNVRVVADKPFSYTLDGEIIESKEMNVSVIPNSLKLIIPGKPLYEEK